jgi:hypothetical protein
MDDDEVRVERAQSGRDFDKNKLPHQNTLAGQFKSSEVGKSQVDLTQADVMKGTL